MPYAMVRYCHHFYFEFLSLSVSCAGLVGWLGMPNCSHRLTPPRLASKYSLGRFRRNYCLMGYHIPSRFIFIFIFLLLYSSASLPLLYLDLLTLAALCFAPSIYFISRYYCP